MDTVVVTRHVGLVNWLRRNGHISHDATVIPHATREDVEGKHVWGVLPLSLAAHAASVTEVPLRIPADMRGVELSAAMVERYRTGPPQTYVVSRRLSEVQSNGG